MKHRFNPDAALYSVLWALLAIFAWQRAGLAAGILLSAGLFPIVMISSMVMLSRTGSFAAEQAVRWGLLAVAAIGLLSYLDVAR